MMWTLAMVPVACLFSLRSIGWLTGGMALLVALACPQAMAMIGAMVVSIVIVATIVILMDERGLA